MARQLKPQKVDEYRYGQTGIVVPIMLNRNNNTFFAEYGGQRVEHPIAAECKNLIAGIVRSSLDLTWIPLIQVKFPGDSRFDGVAHIVGLDYKPLEVARRSDGVWLTRHWGVAINNPKSTQHSSNSIIDKSDDPAYGSQVWIPGQGKRAEFDELILPLVFYQNYSHIPASAKIPTHAFIAYTEDTMKALSNIVQMVIALDKQLRVLVESAAGLALLDAMAHKSIPMLLPSPSENTQETSDEANDEE